MAKRNLLMGSALCVGTLAIGAAVLVGKGGLGFTRASGSEKEFSFDQTVASQVPYGEEFHNVETGISSDISSRIYLKQQVGDPGSEQVKRDASFFEADYACGRTFVFEAGINGLIGFELKFSFDYDAAFDTPDTPEYDHPFTYEVTLDFFGLNQYIGSTEYSVDRTERNHEYVHSWSRGEEQGKIDEVTCSIHVGGGTSQDVGCVLSVDYFKLTWDCKDVPTPTPSSSSSEEVDERDQAAQAFAEMADALVPEQNAGKGIKKMHEADRGSFQSILAVPGTLSLFSAMLLSDLSFNPNGEIYKFEHEIIPEGGDDTQVRNLGIQILINYSILNHRFSFVASQGNDANNFYAFMGLEFSFDFFNGTIGDWTIATGSFDDQTRKFKSPCIGFKNIDGVFYASDSEDAPAMETLFTNFVAKIDDSVLVEGKDARDYMGYYCDATSYCHQRYSGCTVYELYEA